MDANIFTRKKEYHSYSVEDFALLELGIGLYTMSSLEKFFDKPSADFSDFFGSQSLTTIKNSLLGISSTALEPQILAFNNRTLNYNLERGQALYRYRKDNGVLSASVAPDLKTFLERYDKAIKFKDTSIDGVLKEDILAVANKIKVSLSGCITFNAQYRVLGCDNKPLIQLRLLDRKNSDESRVVALKGSPTIVDVTKSLTGLEYSSYASNRSLGVFQPPFEGGLDNPKNSIAAKLDIRYDETKKLWQAGTHQILARLTTDVDSAEVGSIDGISNTNSISTYNASSNAYIGQFSIGKAMPLSMKNNNPHMYGPNFIGCPEEGAKDIEIIQVVNRSRRSFKKGDVVVASDINSEWIIQGFDLPSTSTKANKVGRWQFQKFIVNTDTFFKDARHATNTNDPNNPDYLRYAQSIRPDVYESRMRTKYYYQMARGNSSPSMNYLNAEDKTALAKLNLFLDLSPAAANQRSLVNLNYDIQLSTKYRQSTIFDQLHSTLGGTNNFNLIGRTNIKKSPTNFPDDFLYQTSLPLFWGPVFPNGYTSASCTLLKDKEVVQSFNTNNNNTHLFFTPTSALSLQPIQDINKSFTGEFLFTDANDSNLHQLPAEVGLNGSLNSRFGYPVERIQIPEDNQNILVSYFYNLLNDNERYSWLLDDDDKDMYDLVPVQPNVIQFSPLQLEFAFSDSKITKPDVIDYRNFQSKRPFLASIYGIDNDYEEGFFLSSKFYSRNGIISVGLPSPLFNESVGSSPYLFGPYLRQPSPFPLGGPRIIPTEGRGANEERSGIIGIIAAKNKFTGPSEGSITLSTEQYFGSPPETTVTGGQVTPLTPIPGIGGALGVAFGGDQNPIRQRSLATWGDPFRSSSIDSIGTTALHVRIFDAWPDQQTFYDGRYFSVLHFNPVPPTGIPTIEEAKELYGDNLTRITRQAGVLIGTFQDSEDDYYSKDIEETEVDFTEPTNENRGFIADRTTVTPSTKTLPVDQWRINTIRRGMLLTEGGFRHWRKVIGINSVEVAKDDDDNLISGSGYKVGDFILFANEAKVEVTSINDNGGVTGVAIKIYADEQNPEKDRGYGFMPFDFYDSVTKEGGVFSIDTDGSGKGAKIIAKTGIVYKRYYLDQCPQARCPITRISKLPDADGKAVVSGNEKTSIALIGGNGEYDAFYFMHNDVLHALLDSTAFNPAYASYIILEIGST